MHLAVVVMGIVVPAGYISTPDAFTERLNANAKWRRLSESWRKDDRPINGTYAAIEKRQEAAARVLYSALTRGEITLYAYTVDDIGKPLLEVLTGAYRSDPAAKTELRLGSIHKSRKPPHGATPCFLRDDWRTWLGIEPLAAETPPPPAIEQPTEPKAEQPKMVRRTAGAKRRKPTYAEIRAWYVERVAKHPPDCLSPSRPDDEASAPQYFNDKGLDGRGIRNNVRKARREVAPPSWQERGAKSSEAYEADRKARASAA
jgi:hypothetical protein